MSKSQLPDAARVALLSLGCAKNLVDSERIASVLEQNGVQVVHELDGAPVAVVNTCGFIDSAKEESIDTILEVADRGAERDGPFTLVVTGCLSERYGEELRRALPEVDAMVGIDPEGAARLALLALGVAPRPGCTGQRVARLTPPAWSYLRVTHGCGNRCAYCAIPLIRGPLRSVPMDQLLEEAGYLAGQGVRELTVIGQDTAAYGIDVDGRQHLHDLLKRLCRVDGLRWIRVLYMHPAHVYDELIETMACEPKICRYADVPLQHASDRVLARMGRNVTRETIEQTVTMLRERITGVALRTTFITGFPGETEADFQELLDFVERMRLERVGCFAYSEEEGTAAAEMAEQVPVQVRQERQDRLMTVQQSIAFELASERIGERTEVLIEEVDAAEGLAIGRSPLEAPDVDPVVFVRTNRCRTVGEFVETHIVDSHGYDVIAEVCGETRE